MPPHGPRRRSRSRSSIACALCGGSHTRMANGAAEDGEWCCTVGSQWPVPDWLDETIVFSHELLPLAIVGALLDATRQGAAAAPRAASVLRGQPHLSDAATVSCDNFA